MKILLMKYYVLLLAIFLSAKTSISQTSTSVSMSHEFSSLAKTGVGGTSAFQTYSSTQVDGSQFFLPDWQKGEVVTNNKEIFNNGLLFIYDKVRQELFIRKKDSSLILLGNKEDIKSFTLKDGDKEFYFVNSVAYTRVNPEVFYQVLVDNSSKLTLLKYIKTSFVKADQTDMMKQRQGDVYDAYVDKYTYYIVNEKGEMQSIQLKSKSFKKVLGDQNNNYGTYMNNHPEPINEEYLINMVKQLNR